MGAPGRTRTCNPRLRRPTGELLRANTRQQQAIPKHVAESEQSSKTRLFRIVAASGEITPDTKPFCGSV